MFNDNGMPELELLARHYRANYFYSSTFNGGGSSVETIYMGEAAAIAWFQRLLQVASVGTDWVIILEDDVRVLKAIDLTSLRFDANGCQVYHLPEEVKQGIKELGGNPHDGAYGGCGGAVIRGSLLRYIGYELQWVDQIRSLFMYLKDTVWSPKRTFAADALLISMIYVNNGVQGGFDTYVLFDHPDISGRLQRGAVSVLHKDKSLYNQTFNFSALSTNGRKKETEEELRP